jgi:sulfur-oxidizing protein SoxA
MDKRSFALVFGALSAQVFGGDAAFPISEAEKRSGYYFLSPETQAMQDDVAANPGMLWVLQGQTLWNTPASASGQSCASCHGNAVQSMKGVAARYPRFLERFNRPINLEQRINLCRTERQHAPAFAYESQQLLALTAFVAHQSRGKPIDVDVTGPARPFFEVGRELYQTRFGQLNLSCAHCHEQNWGRKLRGETISQGHGNGYPAYRLDWQTLGSLHRRLQNCHTAIRAQPFKLGSLEYVNLELFLAGQARGLPIETPAVRR